MIYCIYPSLGGNNKKMITAKIFAKRYTTIRNAAKWIMAALYPNLVNKSLMQGVQ